MPTVIADQDQPLDALLWRAYGRAAVAIEGILDGNPGLADLGAHLPHGTPVEIPEARPAPPAAGLLQLWD